MDSLLKKPRAWLPIAMSLTILASILITLAIAGLPTNQSVDEGTGAHLFQIWLLLEAMMLMYFAAKWLPQAPKQAFSILAVQIIAVLAACTPIFLLHF